jgi:hypothetical protein
MVAANQTMQFVDKGLMVRMCRYGHGPTPCDGTKILAFKHSSQNTYLYSEMFEKSAFNTEAALLTRLTMWHTARLIIMCCPGRAA